MTTDATPETPERAYARALNDELVHAVRRLHVDVLRMWLADHDPTLQHMRNCTVALMNNHLTRLEQEER